MMLIRKPSLGEEFYNPRQDITGERVAIAIFIENKKIKEIMNIDINPIYENPIKEVKNIRLITV